MSSISNIDINIARKNGLVDDALFFVQNMPLFSVVEINLHGKCTRRCDFCPISSSDYHAPNTSMEDVTFHKIVKSLLSVNYQGLVIFSGFCEPFLHSSLLTYVEQLRSSLPLARLEIITNGDLLTKDKAHFLFKVGLNTLCISIYDGQSEYEKFEAFRDECGMSTQQIILRRRFYQDNNYGFVFSNRSGCIKSDKYGTTHEKSFPWDRSCNYPFYYTFIDVDGAVLSCPHDWFRQGEMGNVNEESLFAIWKGEKLCSLRKQLLGDDRRAPQCANCSTDGLIMGNRHRKAWEPFF